MIAKMLLDLLTEYDNETFDIGRVLAALTILVFLGLSIYNAIETKKFDAQQFGIGAGSVFAGLGGSIAMTKEFKKGAGHGQTT